jgi:hypothetical protein
VGERGTWPVMAGGPEGARLTRGQEVGGEPDGWAPPVSDQVKKRKGKWGGWAGEGASWAAWADGTHERERKGAGGLVVLRAKKKKKRKRAEGNVVWTSLGALSRWVPGPTTRWPLGLLDLGHTAPDGMGRKDYGGGVLR